MCILEIVADYRFVPCSMFALFIFGAWQARICSSKSLHNTTDLGEGVNPLCTHPLFSMILDGIISANARLHNIRARTIPGQ